MNIGLDMSKQNGLNCVDVASMEDFDATGDNSEFQSASGNLPPELDLNPPAELLKNTSYYTDDDGSPEGFGHGGYVDGGIYPHRLCLWQQPSLWDNGKRNDDSMIIQRLNHKLTIYWHIADMEYPSPAVCYDCMCLISLIWTMMSLSYDGDGTVKWTGHDGGYDCSPAGILGCLPWCLCLPWVMNWMTQYLTKINRLGLDMMLSKAMNAGGQRRVCTSDTPPEACSFPRSEWPPGLCGRLGGPCCLAAHAWRG